MHALWTQNSIDRVTKTTAKSMGNWTIAIGARGSVLRLRQIALKPPNSVSYISW